MRIGIQARCQSDWQSDCEVGRITIRIINSPNYKCVLGESAEAPTEYYNVTTIRRWRRDFLRDGLIKPSTRDPVVIFSSLPEEYLRDKHVEDSSCLWYLSSRHRTTC